MRPETSGLIFNIQRFSIHDGPGIRTTVFLKGCSLNCLWCHNPESISPVPQLMFFPRKCIGCGTCAKVCLRHARKPGGGAAVDSALCVRCGECARQCYPEALTIAGKNMMVSETLAEIAADAGLYERSGGGVTFSGGEPLMQAGFLGRLLPECRKAGIHTAVDTAGNVPWSAFAQTLRHTDLYLYDVKALSEERHRAYTGFSNKRILSNLEMLSRSHAEIWIRIPVIPGFNDSDEEMAGIFGMLSGLGNVRRIELLPFHNTGEGKYAALGLDYGFKGVEPPSEERMARLRARWIPEDKR